MSITSFASQQTCLLQKMLKKLKKYISLEPVIFLWAFGWSILGSTKVEKNLLIWKICHLELEYNETICTDLTHENNSDIMAEVQIRLNNFEMVGTWLSSTPGVIYSFFIGSLSDDFGFKPCVYLPLLGATFGTIFSLINYIWIRDLPTEFFYISGDFWCYVLGGSTVYYLGTYGYGASISKETKRASLLARFDAMELLGLVAGSLLSPITFKLLGYYGSYLTYFFSCLLSLIYLKWFVQEPMKTKQFRFKGFSKFFNTYFIKPIKEMFLTISKKRPGNLRCLLLIQLLAYGLLWFNIQWSFHLEYNYMLLVFKGFTADQYAYYTAAMQVLMSLFMLLLMPNIKVHESMFCVLALAPTALAYFILPWITNLWAFFGKYIVGSNKYILSVILVSFQE